MPEILKIGIIIVFVVLLFVGGIVGFVMFMVAPSKIPPRFAVGDMVRSRVSQQIGQVVSRSSDRFSDWQYAVRFANVSMTTQTHLIAPDDPIKVDSFSIVWMRDYELEPMSWPQRQGTKAQRHEAEGDPGGSPKEARRHTVGS